MCYMLKFPPRFSVLTGTHRSRVWRVTLALPLYHTTVWAGWDAHTGPAITVIASKIIPIVYVVTHFLIVLIYVIRET